MDIRELAFEQIKDNYSWGMYGNLKIIIDMKDSYINATDICAMGSKRTGNKKELKKWMKKETSKELIKEIKSMEDFGKRDLTRTVNTGEIITRGTYVHPLLILHIIS